MRNPTVIASLTGMINNVNDKILKGLKFDELTDKPTVLLRRKLMLVSKVLVSVS